jgi:hypothetical protein
VQGTKRFKEDQMDIILQLGSCILPGDGALDEPVRVGLRRIDFGVFASVLETLVPAQVCEYR